MDNYKSLFDKISASDDFKNSTEQLLIASTSSNHKKTHRKYFMHAIAACLAVVIMLSFFLFPFGSANHSFSIKANAQTLVSDTDFTPITDITASQMGFTGTDWAEIAGVLNLSENNTEDIQITNEAFFSLNVEGDNIEKIHFELNDGYFEVKEDVTNKLLLPHNKLSNPNIGMQKGFLYFEDINLEYDNQIKPIGKDFEGDWITMNILRPYEEETHKKLIEDMVNLSVFRPDAQKGLESEEYFESTFENYLNEMYKDTEIHITCEYSDGSKLTKTLKLYADCEIIGTKEEYFLVSDSTYTDENTHEKYEKFEVYDYTVKLCAKIV